MKTCSVWSFIKRENFIHFQNKNKKNSIEEIIRHWTRQLTLSAIWAQFWWLDAASFKHLNMNPFFQALFEEITSDMTRALEQNSAADISLWQINDMWIKTQGWAKQGSICWYSDHWNEDSNTDRLIHHISLPCTWKYRPIAHSVALQLLWDLLMDEEKFLLKMLTTKNARCYCVSVGSSGKKHSSLKWLKY